MSANIKASTDGTQAIIGVGGVDQMTVSNAGVVTANSFVGAMSGNASSATALATGSTTARTLANRFADVVNVLDFGADPTGSTDSSIAFQNAINALPNGGTIEFNGKYLIDNGIIVNYNVALVGKNKLPDQDSGKVDPSLISCQLIVNSTKTINIKSGASISDCLIVKKGLAIPFVDQAAAVSGVASYAGTAITIQGANTVNGRIYGSTCERLLIIGFNQAIYLNNVERCTIDFVRGDCTNGIKLQASGDICYISNCHFWPYTTAHQGFEVSTAYRSGKAYYITSTVDWSKLTNCFSYAYNTGFHIEAVNDVQLIGCSADWIASIKQNGTNYASRGFWITGNAQQIKLIGCQSAGQYQGVNIDVTSTQTVSLIGHSCWGNDYRHVHVEQGNAIISGCTFTDFPNQTRSVTATRSGTVATATVQSSTPYTSGDTITISGASNTEWNGSYTVTAAPSSITIEFTVPSTHSATAGTGAAISAPTQVSQAVAISNSGNATITNSTFEDILNTTIFFNSSNQADIAYFNRFINSTTSKYKNTNLQVTSSGLGSGANNEGGTIKLSRSYDDAYAYGINVYGNTNSGAQSFRVIDSIASAERFKIDGTGNVYALGAYNSTTANTANVVVSSTGALQRSTSSIKYKTQVEDIDKEYSYNLLNCRPVWFRSTNESDNQSWSHWGFIAEEVAKIDPRLVQWRTIDISYGVEGEVIETPLEEPVAEGVSYDRFVPHLLNVISDLEKRIKVLEFK